MPITYHVLFAVMGGNRPAPASFLDGSAEEWPGPPVRELAEAISDLGHRVSLIGPGSRADDVAGATGARCRPIPTACDVLVVVPQDAGDGNAWPSDTTARWRILWLDRKELADALDPVGFDYVYVAWAHLRRPVMSRWGLASDRVLTTGVGVPQAVPESPDVAERNPYHVLLLGEPEPSLRLAAAILADLRQHYDRFSVEILTSSSIDVRAELARASFLVATPSAVERCARTVLQAKQAGVVVLAGESNPAAELILTEHDGVLVQEDGSSPAFAKACAGQILRLCSDHALTARLRARAVAEPRGWHAVARRWVAHWDRLAAPEPRASRPTVSVVMAVWNAEPFVQEAVDSILGQTEWDLEFIVVDDGSTDTTGQILDGYDDVRLTVIHEENRGVWAAVNRGLREVRGQLIARMDGDDIAHPRRLEHQLEFFERHPRVALIGTACHKIDATGRIFMLYPVPGDDRAIKQRLPHGNPFIQPAVLMRPAVLDRVGVYRPHEAEDYDLWIRVSERFEVANLEAPLHKVRRTGKSRVATHEKAIIDSVRHCAERALERYVRGQDAEGYPPQRRRPVLGLPLGHLRWRERRAYAETLYAWGDAVFAKDRRMALFLYVKATLLAPESRKHWRAWGGCLLGIRGRRPAPR